MRCVRVFPLVLTLGAWACAPTHAGNPDLTVVPNHASMFGHESVSLEGDFSSLLPLKRVTIGGNALYNLEITSTRIKGVLQGAVRVGPAVVQLDGAADSRSYQDLFTFVAPARNAPVSWVAFGGSFTQGVQSTGIEAHSQLWGVTGQLLRAAGVFSGTPLFNVAVASPLTTSDFTPDCLQKPGTGVTTQGMLHALLDPVSGAIQPRRARVDPDLQPRNVAVGSSTVNALLHGGEGDTLTLGHLVLEPGADVNTPLMFPQVARLETWNADVGLSVDLMLHDVLPAVLGDMDVVPSAATPVTQLRPQLTELLNRLGALRGQYFLGNVPDVDYLPHVAHLRQVRVDGGMDTAAVFEAKLAQVHDVVTSYNALLDELTAMHPNIHVVDINALLASQATGVVVNGGKVTLARFGGLLSLDDLHFTDTGNALLANTFVDAMNPALNTVIPHVDVDTVNQADRLQPAVFRQAGLLCVP